MTALAPLPSPERAPRPDRLARWGRAALWLVPLAALFPLLAALDTLAGPFPWSGWWTTWKDDPAVGSTSLMDAGFLVGLGLLSSAGQWMLLVLPFRRARGTDGRDGAPYLRWRRDRTRAMALCWALALAPPAALLAWWTHSCVPLHNAFLLTGMLARITPGRGPLPFLWRRIVPPYDAGAAEEAWRDAAWTVLQTWPEAVGARVHLLHIGEAAGHRSRWVQWLRNAPGARWAWARFERASPHAVHPIVAYDQHRAAPPAWLAAARRPAPTAPSSTTSPTVATAGGTSSTSQHQGQAQAVAAVVAAVSAAVDAGKPMRDAVLAAWVDAHRPWEIPMERAEGAVEVFTQKSTLGWGIPVPDSRHEWMAFLARRKQADDAGKM